MLRGALSISTVLKELFETMIDHSSSLSSLKLGSEEEWSKSIKYGNLCPEGFKLPPSSQFIATKKLLTNVSEEIYKSNHVTNISVEMII